MSEIEISNQQDLGCVIPYTSLPWPQQQIHATQVLSFWWVQYRCIVCMYLRPTYSIMKTKSVFHSTASSHPLPLFSLLLCYNKSTLYQSTEVHISLWKVAWNCCRTGVVARIRTTSSEKYALPSIAPFLVTALTLTRKLGGILQFILSLPLSLSRLQLRGSRRRAPNGIHNHSPETHEFHFPKQHFYFAGPRAI